MEKCVQSNKNILLGLTFVKGSCCINELSQAQHCIKVRHFTQVRLKTMQ